MTMKMVNGVTTIKDGECEISFDTMKEAFFYLGTKKFMLEIAGALPLDRRDTVSSLIPGECKTKRVRYSIEGVPV